MLRRWVVVFALIILFGIWLRWHALGSESLWLDEGYTAWLMRLSYSGIYHALQADTSPPLYYFLLKAWTLCLGTGEAAMRSLSTLMGCAAFGLIAAMSLRLFAAWPARVLAMAILSVSLFQIQFSQEARAYEMGAACFALALVALLMFLRDERWHSLALFVLAGAAMVYLHNTLWFYLAALDVAWLILPGQTPLRRRLLHAVIANLLILAAFVPWLPTFVAQTRGMQGAFWIEKPTFNHITQVVFNLAGVDATMLRALLSPWFGVIDEGDRLFRFGTVFLLTAATIAGLASPRHRRSVAALVILTLLPILLSFAYSRVRQSIFLDRTFLPTSLLLPLLIAYPLELLSRHRWTVALAAAPAMCVLLLASLSTLSERLELRKEDWRSAIAHINAAPAQSLAVFLCSEAEPLYDYYSPQARGSSLHRTGLPMGFFETDPPRCGQRVLSSQPLQTFAARWLAAQPRELLLIRSHEWWADPDDLVPRFLAQRFTCTRSVAFRGLTVDHYVPASIASR